MLYTFKEGSSSSFLLKQLTRTKSTDPGQSASSDYICIIANLGISFSARGASLRVKMLFKVF